MSRSIQGSIPAALEGIFCSTLSRTFQDRNGNIWQFRDMQRSAEQAVVFLPGAAAYPQAGHMSLPTGGHYPHLTNAKTLTGELQRWPQIDDGPSQPP